MVFKWDDDTRAEAIELYEGMNPTPENSSEMVKSVSEQMEGTTVNGVRMILSKAEVYIKKTPASGGSSSSGTTSTRISKADAIDSLNTAISAIGLDPNDEVISKLTGKAALYFAEVINSTNSTEE